MSSKNKVSIYEKDEKKKEEFSSDDRLVMFRRDDSGVCN